MLLEFSRHAKLYTRTQILTVRHHLAAKNKKRCLTKIKSVQHSEGFGCWKRYFKATGTSGVEVCHHLAPIFMSDVFRFLFHTVGICITNRGNDNYTFIYLIWLNKSTLVSVSVTTGGTEGSRCRPRNDNSRLHIIPLPKNMKPVTSQKARGSWW